MKVSGLIIRRAQMRVFEQRAVRNFQNEVRAYISEKWPDECGMLGDEGLGELIGAGMERAQSYGLETEYDIVGYIYLMLALGRDFDTDPRMPWAQHVLTSAAVLDKIDRLFGLAKQYLDYE